MYMREWLVIISCLRDTATMGDLQKAHEVPLHEHGTKLRHTGSCREMNGNAKQSLYS